ncbi:MAG TPA: ABC transporter permease [Myxococcales bacterium]|nr:ABC transporter permease [Myxococcales bacterium]
MARIWLANRAMLGLRQDLRGALRTLRRSPAFAAIVVLTLGIAIGATSSVFSVVRGLLLKPLPYREPDKLVRFFTSSRQFATGTVSLASYREDFEHLSSMSGVAAWGYGSGSLAGSGAPEHIGLGRATSSLLPVLGVQPALGRWFSREEEEPGHGRVVVLGRALWQRRFGGDPNAVGQTVEISGHPFKIVGVLAEDLELPESFDAWRPLPFPPDQLTPQARGSSFLRVIGRLARNAALADARAELAVVSAQLRASFPEVYSEETGYHLIAVPLLDQMVGSVRPTLWMLFGAVVLVLLMACANVGNLMLARGTARERELAVRAALGAGRGRLVRQMLVESMCLALLGGAAGVAIAVWGVDLLVAAGPANLPRANQVRVDGAVLAFALAASLSSGLLFGLLPALTATETRLQDALRGGAASAAPRPRRLRRALVAADVALALVLVSGAALLLRSFGHLVQVDPGFDPGGAVTLVVGVPGDERQIRKVFHAVLQRLRELPGTSAAGGVDYQPLSGVANDQTFEVEGRPVPAGARPPDEEIRIVTPGWLEAMRIPLLQGRTPQETDSPDQASVAVINRSFARKYWPSSEALGQRLRLSGDPRWWTIVGVVGDVREFGLDADIRPTMYFPFDQHPNDVLTLVLRSKAPGREMLRVAQQALLSVDPLASAWQVQSVSEMLEDSLAQRSFALKLLHGFAGLALLLAGLGLYGVLAYTVAQRTREIGVRMALGARPAQAIALVARESAMVVGAGLAVGVVGALITARLIAGLLFEVGPADPLALLAALLVLGAVALAATLVPARRAALVDPAVALREE